MRNKQCDPWNWEHVGNSEPLLVEGPLGELPSVGSPCNVPQDDEGSSGVMTNSGAAAASHTTDQAVTSVEIRINKTSNLFSKLYSHSIRNDGSEIKERISIS